jgi:hypothetical protein
MMRSLHPEIRRVLREHPDGLTAFAIAAALGVDKNAARKSIVSMPDAYIDRWELNPRNGQYQAVWCAVEVPPHCPRPTSTKGKK